jgi:hypothetical protein
VPYFHHTTVHERRTGTADTVKFQND